MGLPFFKRNEEEEEEYADESGDQINLFIPTSFDEAQSIADQLKEGHAVIVNLTKMSIDGAQRTIDLCLERKNSGGRQSCYSMQPAEYGCRRLHHLGCVRMSMYFLRSFVTYACILLAIVQYVRMQNDEHGSDQNAAVMHFGKRSIVANGIG